MLTQRIYPTKCKHKNIRVLKINQNCVFSLSYAPSKNVSNKIKAYKKIKAIKINQNYAFSFTFFFSFLTVFTARRNEPQTWVL